MKTRFAFITILVTIIFSLFIFDHFNSSVNDKESYPESVMNTISNSFDGAYSLYTKVMNSEGDMDVLGSAFNADEITWWENNASNNFTTFTIVSVFLNSLSVYEEIYL